MTKKFKYEKYGIDLFIQCNGTHVHVKHALYDTHITHKGTKLISGKYLNYQDMRNEHIRFDVTKASVR